MHDHERHARDLFDRARAGDQNAMKELVRVREDAVRGDPLNRKVYDYLLQYGKEHPIRGEQIVGSSNSGVAASRAAQMGSEERHALGILRAADRNDPRAVMAALHRLPQYGHPDTVRAACVTLSQQQPWTDSRLEVFGGLLPDEPRRAVFRHSVRVAPDQAEMAALRETIPVDLRAETGGTLCAGYCLGTARKFQLARLPSSPVSVVGADIGWECGL